jgi:hypothetical protein
MQAVMAGRSPNRFHRVTAHTWKALPPAASPALGERRAVQAWKKEDA